MREIEFRGKRKDTGKWVYGFYYQFAEIEDYHRIFENNYRCGVAVDPETVGQYTGLRDKNGVKIFEGDIVLVSYFGRGFGENLGVFETEEEITGVIEYGDLGLLVKKIRDKNGKWRAYTGYKQGEGSCEFAYLHDVYEDGCEEYDFEVIGNIHDNPELLEVGE
ncbi:phage protein [Spirochaetia bacterium]|nr:phage protein [Spirochaetia bacterium]